MTDHLPRETPFSLFIYLTGNFSCWALWRGPGHPTFFFFFISHPNLQNDGIHRDMEVHPRFDIWALSPLGALHPCRRGHGWDADTPYVVWPCFIVSTSGKYLKHNLVGVLKRLCTSSRMVRFLPFHSTGGECGIFFFSFSILSVFLLYLVYLDIHSYLSRWLSFVIMILP